MDGDGMGCAGMQWAGWTDEGDSDSRSWPSTRQSSILNGCSHQIDSQETAKHSLARHLIHRKPMATLRGRRQEDLRTPLPFLKSTGQSLCHSTCFHHCWPGMQQRITPGHGHGHDQQASTVASRHPRTGQRPTRGH
jgi:hypothetical protein